MCRPSNMATTCALSGTHGERIAGLGGFSTCHKQLAELDFLWSVCSLLPSFDCHSELTLGQLGQSEDTENSVFLSFTRHAIAHQTLIPLPDRYALSQSNRSLYPILGMLSLPFPLLSLNKTNIWIIYIYIIRIYIYRYRYNSIFCVYI